MYYLQYSENNYFNLYTQIENHDTRFFPQEEARYIAGDEDATEK